MLWPCFLIISVKESKSLTYQHAFAFTASRTITPPNPINASAGGGKAGREKVYYGGFFIISVWIEYEAVTFFLAMSVCKNLKLCCNCLEEDR